MTSYRHRSAQMKGIRARRIGPGYFDHSWEEFRKFWKERRLNAAMFHGCVFGGEFRDTFAWNYSVGGAGFCTIRFVDLRVSTCGTQGWGCWGSPRAHRILIPHSTASVECAMANGENSRNRGQIDRLGSIFRTALGSDGVPREKRKAESGKRKAESGKRKAEGLIRRWPQIGTD